jgi:hypothetical protein
VQLPRRVPAGAVSRRSRTPLSILIVEDERELGRVLFDYLAEIGHRPEVLYIEQQGRRVDVAADACREFIGHRDHPPDREWSRMTRQHELRHGPGGHDVLLPSATPHRPLRLVSDVDLLLAATMGLFPGHLLTHDGPGERSPGVVVLRAAGVELPGPADDLPR